MKSVLEVMSEITVLLLLLVSVDALAQTPPPGQFGIRGLAFWGSGCRPGTVSYDVAPDARAITLIFSDFQVEAYPASGLQMRMCEVDLQIAVPSGWSYSIQNVDVRGYAYLSDKRAFGRMTTQHAFRQSPGPRVIMDQQQKGPFDGNYLLTGAPRGQDQEWSPCGRDRMARLRTRIQARANGGARSNAVALVSVDSIDGQLRQTLRLAWRRCPGGRDDPVDAPGSPPGFGASYVAECTAKLVDRQGRLVDLFTGSGFGVSQGLAQQAAEADALRECRNAARQGNHRCEIDSSSCTISAG